MPNLDIALPHKLGRDEALRRIKKRLEEAKTEHAGDFSDLQEEWDGYAATFSFSAMGSLVSGNLTVEDKRLKFSVNLPFAAIFFMKEIESAIRKKAKSLLE